MDGNSYLKWLDDETFFSLCCRSHTFFGRSFRETSLGKALPCDSRAPLHDFPCNLSAFQHATNSGFGSPESIIKIHTILPFFVPFQSIENIQSAISSMMSPALGSTKFRLGLITGRFGAEHPLKSCYLCAKSDIEEHGIAYWHLKHQYPGVTLCPLHAVSLKETNLKRKWKGRFSWALPNEDDIEPPQEELVDAIKDKIFAFSKSCIELADIGVNRSLKAELVSAVYREGLQRRFDTQRSEAEVFEHLLDYTNMLRPFRPLHGLPDNPGTLRSMIQQLTGPPRGHCHPLKHLTLITWLFGDVPTFLSAYLHAEARGAPEKAKQRAPDPTPPPSAMPLPHPTRGAPRPKVLKGHLRELALEQLAIGARKADVCSSFGVTVSTVNKLLRSSPNVADSRAKALSAKEISQHREIWLDLQARYPELSAKALRGHAQGTYAWLYRNDRSWLLEQTASLPSGRIGNHSKVDWSARDRELEASIRATVQREFGTELKAAPTRAQLFSLVPNLPTCLEKRDRYPNTRALLNEIQEAANATTQRHTRP